MDATLVELLSEACTSARAWTWPQVRETAGLVGLDGLGEEVPWICVALDVLNLVLELNIHWLPTPLC